MKARLFSLHTRDLIKGLIIAVISAVITAVVSELQAGTEVDMTLLKKMGIVAATTFLSYIVKNFFTNSRDEFATSEPKSPIV